MRYFQRRPGQRGAFARLARRAEGVVREDLGTRELYARDASLYRRRPRAVLQAARADDLTCAVEECHRLGVPLTVRGAGTSLAGQAVGDGLVVDTSLLRRIRIDDDGSHARVEPGVVLDALNAATMPHGRVFGPDVATASRATLGGMIGNNSAGTRSMVYGLTADHVVSLDLTLADGREAEIRRGVEPPQQIRQVAPLSSQWQGPTLLRRVSGYALDALAGDDPDWPRLFCGSEGTLGVTRGARVRLVRIPDYRALVVLPFAGVRDALDAVIDLNATKPSAVELLDDAMLDPRNRPTATADIASHFHGAAAMLVVEYQGTRDEVEARLRDHPPAHVVRDDAMQATVWAVRRAGLARALRGEGVAFTGPDDKPLPFIEDPAVPPEHLADFAGEVMRVLADEKVGAVWFGHAGVGCLHIRPLMDLRAPGMVARMRRIAEATADLVVAHNGSLSGEHGDGRVRSALLDRMYTPSTMAAFRQTKALLDPDGILNPGVIVNAAPIDTGLLGAAPAAAGPGFTALSFVRERGLVRAAEVCNNNGTCRAAHGVMCPSYQALRDERHSTRGRANLLRAALEGRIVGGLASPELHEALDLCLGCTACRSECPASVDMAVLKVEALAHRYRTQRPSLRVRAAANIHRVMQAGSRVPAIARLVGVVGQRVMGRPVPVPRGDWARNRAPSTPDAHTLVFADTMNRFVDHDVIDAALEVLGRDRTVTWVAGGCCGRPAFSQGFVGTARRQLQQLVAHLDDGTDRPIVVLEPSCQSMFVEDGRRLLPDDPTLKRVAGRVVGFVDAAQNVLPVPVDGDQGVVTHAHCHLRSTGTTTALESLAGSAARDSGAGCCGMAGAFGYLHPEVSRTVAADRFLPALSHATRLVAPGFSCRCQARDLTGVPALHPAQELRDQIRQVSPHIPAVG